MATDPVTCAADDDIGRVVADMRDHQIRRVPVVDRNNRVSGIVGISDLIRHNAVAPADICMALDHIMMPKPPVAEARAIKEHIASALRCAVEVDADRITVTVVDDKVILTGRVSSQAERQEAERAAWSAPGVKTVEDDLVIAA